MKKKLLTAALASILMGSSAQTFQKEYSNGNFPNQINRKGYDTEPTQNGYTAFTETSTEKHLILTDVNGVFQSALNVKLDQTNVIGEGSTFAELNNGDYFVSGIKNGHLVFYSFAPSGSPFTYDEFQMQGTSLSTNEFMQIIQVENYDDEHVYVRGIYRSQYGGGEYQPPMRYLHFLCMAKREGQPGNYHYSVQWMKNLQDDIDINYTLYNSDGRYGDMHVSSINGDLYYVGKDIDHSNPLWHLRKFDLNGTELYKKEIIDENYFEPTGVVETTDGKDIFICGFNNSKSFVAKFKAGSGSQTWIYDYYMNSYESYKFRSIEYSGSKVILVGEARSGKNFGFSLAISSSLGQPLSHKTYYDYFRIDEIAKDGSNNYVLVGSTLKSYLQQTVNRVGLIKTNNVLETNCSSNLAPPSYGSPLNYVQNAYQLSNLYTFPLINLQGGVPMIDYSEKNACCQIDIANQTVYLCNPSLGVILNPGLFDIYIWSDGSKTRDIRVYQPGVYSVIVFDQNGCWALIEFNVIQTPQLAFGVSNPTPISCYGANDGNICFTSSGNITNATIIYPGSGGSQNVPITSNNFCFYNLIGLSANPGLEPGYYSITVYDQYGCSDTFTYNMTQPAPLSISSSNTPPSLGQCNGQLNLFVSGGTAPYTATVTRTTPYYFYTGNALTTLTGLCVGCYTVTVQDANGCITTSTCEPVSSQGNKTNGTTDIKDLETETSLINIYPNPVSETLNIQSPKDVKMELYNILGERVNTLNVHSQKVVSFDISSLPAGIYTLKSNDTKQTFKIIKN